MNQTRTTAATHLVLTTMAMTQLTTTSTQATARLERPADTAYEIGGPLRKQIDGVVENWLIPAPEKNPAMTEMFADRDKQPYRNLLPWSGEFFGKYLTASAQMIRLTRARRCRRISDREHGSRSIRSTRRRKKEPRSSTTSPGRASSGSACALTMPGSRIVQFEQDEMLTPERLLRQVGQEQPATFTNVDAPYRFDAVNPGSNHLMVSFPRRCRARGLRVERAQFPAGPEIVAAEAVPHRGPEDVLAPHVVHVHGDAQHGVNRQHVRPDVTE